MATHIFDVHSNPVPGREDEYNDWYTNQHLSDVLASPGFVAAQRFEVAAPPASGRGRSDVPVPRDLQDRG